MRSSEIQKSLNIEPLLLRIKRSQLRWFGHVSRMPQERLPKQALLAKANGRRPVGRPRTRWANYTEDLGWNRIGLHRSEIMDVIEDREVWRLNRKKKLFGSANYMMASISWRSRRRCGFQIFVADTDFVVQYVCFNFCHY